MTTETKAPGVGDPAPDFTLKSIGLKDISLRDYRGKNDFEAATTQVLGISTDSPFSHENWAKAVGIQSYPLLSDVHRATVRDYGVYWADWNANSRATFILDRSGTIRFVERYGKGELPDPDKILNEIKKLG